MKNFIESFTKQIEESYLLSKSFSLEKINPSSIRNIVISGMGGSGIAASIVNEYVKEECPIPVIVTKGYHPPAFINSETLFIASSYSGNTEETIESIHIAIQKGCKIVAITSGGEIAEIARKNQFTLQILPSGFPPRASLAYSFYQLISIFHKLGFTEADADQQWLSAINVLNASRLDIIHRAQSIASKLHNKIPVIYSEFSFEAPIIRFRQQLNENSKKLAFNNVIPEMNHNELVGWKNVHPDLVVVMVKTAFDYSRNRHRMTFLEKIIQQNHIECIEIDVKSTSKLMAILEFIHLTDYVSVFLADLNGVDPVEVNVIDQLKTELSKIS